MQFSFKICIHIMQLDLEECHKTHITHIRFGYMISHDSGILVNSIVISYDSF